MDIEDGRTSRPATRDGPVLALLALAGLITALDSTIVVVALPDIARDTGLDDHTLQWVISAYAVAYGGLLLLGGRLADLVGRRRMFCTGLILYGAGSVLGSVAGATGPLLAARAVQGAGGAVLFPATLSLVTTMFAEGPARNRALGLWSVSGAAGLSLGSLLGGALTGAFGWPAVFWVNLPLAAVAWTGAWVLLPADRCRAESGRGRGGFDIAGAVTGTCGITLLVFALAQGERWGWTSARVVGCAVAALVLPAGFAVVESRAREPLVPPRLVRTRARTLAVVLAFGATAQSLTYFLTLYLQDDLGFSPVRTGVAFLAPTLAITAGNLLGERAIGRWGVRATLCAGLVTSALGSAAAALVLVLVPDAGYTYLLAGVVCHGLGTGTTFTALWVIVGQGVRATEQGTASGLGSTALQCGAGIGLALLVPVGETRDVMWLIAAGCLAAAALVLTGPRDEARHPAGGAALPDHPPLPARTAADHDTIEGTNEGGPWTAR